MTDDDVRDLLGAWALDAVDDVERKAVERLIRDDPEAAAEARALRDTVTRLAVSDAAAPPAALRAQVLAAVESTRQLEPSAGHTHGSESPPARRRSKTLRLLAAAAILIGIAVPSGIAVLQAQRAEQAEQQVELLAEALSEPGATLVRADVSGGGKAAMVTGGDTVLLALSGLPELSGQDYQLWVIQDDVPVSAGVLHPKDGLLTRELTDVPATAALALTIEPTGGSTQPTTDPLVVLGP
ncbi:anti-sigma factor [Occultella aeris]|uniref:Regulator of SigK n=1 Tax=Occultella aeris TaxID=2761496 RepID=A0A7M4DIC5_9MICO|nr:anti-sigma factor [Occultella aeris]VZO36697.1 Anti-sigma-K factor RskA [Occultella aeris]